MKYRSEVDGLRALAVLPVILFHAGFDTLSGGFLGVDVFFTISGFLITSIILKDMDASQFSLTQFYIRRIKRILPALFIILACSTIAALTFFTPQLLKPFSESLMAVSAFGSNIYFWLSGGYFGLESELKPLLHTWSLAVEEQYYVLFPLALMMFWKIGKNKLFILIILATLFSLILSQWGAHHKPGANFFLLPTRMWQILLGSCLAFYINMNGEIKTSKSISQYLSLTGIALITSSYLFLSEKTPLPSLYALMPTIGALLIIAFAKPQTIANYILTNRYMVFIGLVSYSAYLWHQPLFVFARYELENPSPLIMAGLSAISLLLAGVTWYFVEQPCRKAKNIKTRNVFLLAFIGLATFFSIGLIGKTTKVFENFYYDVRLTPEQKEIYMFVKKHTDYPMMESLIDNGDCHFWDEEINDENTKRFEQCHQKYGNAIVVLGDSHAMNIYNIVVKTDINPFIFGVTQGGCRAYEKLPHCHYNGFNKFLKTHKNQIDYILFHQSGSHMIKDKNGKYATQEIFQKDAKYSIDTNHIRALLNYIRSLAEKTPTYWLGPYVEGQLNFKSNINLRKDDFKMPEGSIPVFQEMDNLIEAESSKQTENKSGYISLVNWMDIQDRSLIIDDCLIYKDPDHLTNCGEDYWAKKLKPYFQKLDKKIREKK